MFDGPTGDDAVTATDDRRTATGKTVTATGKTVTAAGKTVTAAEVAVIAGGDSVNRQPNRAHPARGWPEDSSVKARATVEVALADRPAGRITLRGNWNGLAGGVWCKPLRAWCLRRREMPGPGRTVMLLFTVSVAVVSIFTLTPIAPLAEAGFPESHERWERTYGVGWGDGYQSQTSSGPRPFADLPPKFPRRPGPHGQHTSCSACAKRHPGGNTYYDRFDAYAASLEMSPGQLRTPGRALSPNPPDRPALSPDRALSPDQALSPDRADERDRETVTSKPERARSRGTVRPGLSHARLPKVVPPAIVHHPSSPNRGSDRTRRETPRVAHVPESLIIRQPR